MTTQNRIGKFCSLCLIGLGLIWMGTIAYQMYSPPQPQRIAPAQPECAPGVRKPETICAGG
jgi:hypothetical protein